MSCAKTMELLADIRCSEQRVAYLYSTLAIRRLEGRPFEVCKALLGVRRSILNHLYGELMKGE